MATRRSSAELYRRRPRSKATHTPFKPSTGPPLPPMRDSATTLAKVQSLTSCAATSSMTGCQERTPKVRCVVCCLLYCNPV
ncbi:hypothetical protein BD413DRAFT_544034 [Trametes elegans]|nr:hypothetical protein BD413DRAFT_544034 [Trametes elegans]